MARHISTRKLSPTLHLSECHPTSEHRGKFWLWDETVGMNLAMGAETVEEALVEAIEYYQEYYAKYKKDYNNLRRSVDAFVDAVGVEDEDVIEG